MRNYERFQQVITYYLKSINASADFIKLKLNESNGKKRKSLEDKLTEFEKRKGKAMEKFLYSRKTLMQNQWWFCLEILGMLEKKLFLN